MIDMKHLYDDLKAKDMLTLEGFKTHFKKYNTAFTVANYVYIDNELKSIVTANAYDSFDDFIVFRDALIIDKNGIEVAPKVGLNKNCVYEILTYGDRKDVIYKTAEDEINEFFN